jgi:hypothetical protein
MLMRLPGWYAALDEVRGHRALASGDIGQARASFNAAARVFGRAGQPLDAHRCTAAAAVLAAS